MVCNIHILNFITLQRLELDDFEMFSEIDC